MNTAALEPFHEERSTRLARTLRDAVSTLQEALDDCPCCSEHGYVKDGICITCGWGDRDHALLVRFAEVAVPALRTWLQNACTTGTVPGCVHPDHAAAQQALALLEEDPSWAT